MYHVKGQSMDITSKLDELLLTFALLETLHLGHDLLELAVPAAFAASGMSGIVVCDKECKSGIPKQSVASSKHSSLLGKAQIAKHMEDGLYPDTLQKHRDRRRNCSGIWRNGNLFSGERKKIRENMKRRGFDETLGR
jgi:hypothetical protein